ncbi:uncharacterized protein [Amphiura filiformis]|uniref:uncharacterized protein n=1 Tax=Amphiura filiformis TaxID=82378 RepID=UPI003B20D633
MSSVGLTRIRLEGVEIFPAQTEGSDNVFNNAPFRLAKARWVADEEAHSCVVCTNKFNQIRRKHHCRQCGLVLCSKCCKEKVPLPQLGFDEPERVCDACLPVAELITKSRSTMANFQGEAAAGLSELTLNINDLKKVVELGGLQTLIYLCTKPNEQLRQACASGLHTLATHQPLLSILADAGAIKAVCSLLSTANENQEQLLIDGISILMIFCKSPGLKAKVVSDGAMQPILNVCSMRVSSAIALIAMQMLNLVTEDEGSHAAIIENDKSALPKLLSLTISPDEQMQEGVLKTLARLSMGTDWHRHRIIQEDFSSSKCLVKVLKNRPKNIQVLVNATCLIANLATCEQDQNSMTDYMDCVCQLLVEFKAKQEILTHVIRALANFAKFPPHSYRLGQHLPSIVSICLKSTNKEVHTNGLRTILYMLNHSTGVTLSQLMRDGATEVFTALASTPGIIDGIQRTLQQQVPERCSPS